MAIGSIVPVRPSSLQRGFTYLGMMFLIVAIGIGLAAAGTVWQTEVQREKEKELLFVGEQFRQAIGTYYENPPAGVKQYPPALEDLLHDPRFPEMRRHLRRIYPDPMTGNTEWGLVKEQERIIGVYSKSENHPLMKVSTHAETYADWTFIYKSNRAVIPPGSPSAVAVDMPNVPVTPPEWNVNNRKNLPAVPPPKIDYDDPCYGQYADDYAICVDACMKIPFETCAACYASRNERKLACDQKRTLPPLVTK